MAANRSRSARTSRTRRVMLSLRPPRRSREQTYSRPKVAGLSRTLSYKCSSSIRHGEAKARSQHAALEGNPEPRSRECSPFPVSSIKPSPKKNKFIQACAKLGVPVVESDIGRRARRHSDGRRGQGCDKNTFLPLRREAGLHRPRYGSRRVVYTDKALKDLENTTSADDLLHLHGEEPSPTTRTIMTARPASSSVREVRLSAGAGFIIPITAR